MATLRSRLPRKRDLVPVLAVSAFVVYTWSIVRYLDLVPGWLDFLDLWSILAILAYAQAFALLESLTVLGVTILIAALLPAKLFRERFVAHGTMMVLTGTLWLAIFHILVGQDPREISIWSKIPLWVVLTLTSFALSWALVHRSERLQEALTSVADRLIVLLYLYVPTGILGLVVVVARNIR